MRDGLAAIRHRLPELLTRVEYDSSAEYEQARADVERLLAIAEAAHALDADKLRLGSTAWLQRWHEFHSALDALDRDTPQ